MIQQRKLNHFRLRYALGVGLGLLCLAVAMVGLRDSEATLESVQGSYATLRDFININSRLNENVLKNRFNLHTNYDVITYDAESGRQQLLKLEASRTSSFAPTGLLSKKFSEKVNLVEFFKGKNAIYRNSWGYFPESVAQAQGAIRSSVVRKRLDELYQHVLLYRNGSGSEVVDAELPIVLSRWRSRLNSPLVFQTSELDVALSHAEVIVNLRSELDELVKAVVQHAVTLEADRLFQAYGSLYDHLRVRTFKLKILVVICVLFLLMVLFYQGRRLDRAVLELEDLNTDLELRIQARTQVIENQQVQLIASAKMSALGAMAGEIAHEINNPLAIIYGKADQLKRRLDSGVFDINNLKEITAKIVSTAERITKIIKGLRTFSRNSEADPAVATPVDRIVEDTLSFCTERFQAQGVELRLNCEDGLEIECRAAQIAQVMVNLLGNACDAVASQAEKWVSLETLSKGDFVQLIVTDSGRGIDAEVVEKMMTPFFSTKEVGKGTGLGLSISLNIAANHEGSLKYDSSCANTRFVLELPKRQSVDRTLEA